MLSIYVKHIQLSHLEIDYLVESLSMILCCVVADCVEFP